MNRVWEITTYGVFIIVIIRFVLFGFDLHPFGLVIDLVPADTWILIALTNYGLSRPFVRILKKIVRLRLAFERLLDNLVYILETLNSLVDKKDDKNK